MRTAGRLLSAGKEGEKQQVRRGWQRGEGLRRPCSRAWTLSQGDLLFRGHRLPMKPPSWDAPCPKCHGVDVKACLDAGNRDPKSRDQADLG